ncbi:hypothetical protein CPC08DRAFT_748945 [Agrocybe pediades]|nr:hypothetical protein CPC08DRAFT_748945 [Agrocybe pediades]
MFQRVTYYWVALVFQIAQTGLAVAGCVIIRANLYMELNSYLFTKRQTFYIITALSTGILIYLIYITSCHDSKSPESHKEIMNAGKHYRISNRCAWANVICLILLRVMYEYIPWKPESPQLSISYNLILPLLFASQLLCLLACFAASNLTHIGALRARGEGMVHDLYLRVPAWTLATSYETTGYAREREIQLEP